MKRKSIAVTTVFLLAVLSMPFIAVAQQPDNTSQNRSSERGVEAPDEKRERIDQIRNSKREEVQQKVTERRATIKADVCERRQERLQRRIPQLATQSNRLLGVIDSMYERVESFYETGQLTVENYNELSNQVQRAQENAYGAVESVASYEFDFDCEDRSAGEQTYAYKLSVGEARTSLKAYRSELVTLISSLRSVVAEEGSEVDSSNNPIDDEVETTQDEPIVGGGQDEE